ncbi:MAG: S41 family peptidase [Planctomycetes bacterium]|nr:S41 family peptidase [Planctomycetota bacterium]
MMAILPLRRGRATLGVAVALLLCVPLHLRAQEAQVGRQVQEILARMDQSQGDAVWDQALALERLGPGASRELAQRVDAARGATKLAMAKALLVLADGADEAGQAAAVRALKDVVRDQNAARELRVRACDLLTRYAKPADVQGMSRDLDQVRDPYVKIALLRTLRQRGRNQQAGRTLQEYLASEDVGVRAEAALALAEIGNVDAAREVLNQLRAEPTERGRRAAAYLEQDKLLGKLERFGAVENQDELVRMRDRQITNLEGELEKLRQQLRSGLPAEGQGGGAAVPGQALLNEIFTRIREQYVDEKKVELQKLIDAAAGGLVDHLDPFSSYMNEDMLKGFNESIRQNYGGIGAVVQMDRKSGFLTIQRPIYGNPAHKAGLRTLDRIVEVEGQSTKGKTVSELVEVLKGPAGTPVTVKVQPFLGGPERTVAIKRDQITLSSVRFDMLPGQVGYVQLAQFGSFASQEVEAALKELERRGMKGLILDLRGNPGGLLSAAVEIADKFLDDDKLIVYSEGRKGTRFGARQEDGGPAVAHRRRLQAKHPDYPLVVLIDEGSASASEIVAGALQAHGRALLVGKQTFGKGSVQNIFPLESVGEKAALRMTIAYYYLPDGRCIHRERDVETWKFVERIRGEIERWKQDGKLNDAQAKELLEQYEQPPGGVEPDYRVDAQVLTPEKQRAYAMILDLQLIEEYIQAQWATSRDAFHGLVNHDGFDVARYPGFEALWTKVQEKLDEAARKTFDKNDLRLLVRSYVRRFVQDDVERVLTSDFQEDRQLQAALMIMAEQVGQPLDKVPELSFIGKTYPDGVTRTREAGKPGQGGAPERDFK